VEVDSQGLNPTNTLEHHTMNTQAYTDLLSVGQNTMQRAYCCTGSVAQRSLALCDMDDALHFSDQAGYCLDAPEVLATGSVRFLPGLGRPGMSMTLRGE